MFSFTNRLLAFFNSGTWCEFINCTVNWFKTQNNTQHLNWTLFITCFLIFRWHLGVVLKFGISILLVAIQGQFLFDNLIKNELDSPVKASVHYYCWKTDILNYHLCFKSVENEYELSNFETNRLGECMHYKIIVIKT